MKWEDLRRSQNVEDRRNERYRRPPTGGPNPYRGYRRSSTGMSNLLLSLLMSRGPAKWLILGLIVLTLFSGGLGGLFNDSSATYDSSVIQTEDVRPSQNTVQESSSTASDEEYDFLRAILGSTEDVWTEAFAEEGLRYHPPTLVVYTDAIQTTGCGFGQAAAGPFYCPADQKVYIDLSFYRELANKYHAPGEFAMAYVLAHEVGHHVQQELGIMDDYHRALQGVSQRQQNQLNVRLELQADYFAGVWAHYVEEAGLLEVGDLESALQAAHAVGDDTLQEEAYGRVVPDSFTHGTSRQRQAWFQRGYTYGDIAHGDTFTITIDEDY